MRSNYLKATMKTAVLAVTILLLGVSVALAQTTVSLTAGPQHALLPDGQSVPMWGLVCTAGPCTSLHYNTGSAANDHRPHGQRPDDQPHEPAAGRSAHVAGHRRSVGRWVG